MWLPALRAVWRARRLGVCARRACAEQPERPSWRTAPRKRQRGGRPDVAHRGPFGGHTSSWHGWHGGGGESRVLDYYIQTK